MRVATARMRNLVGFARRYAMRTPGPRSCVHAEDARRILRAWSSIWPP